MGDLLKTFGAIYLTLLWLAAALLVYGVIESSSLPYYRAGGDPIVLSALVVMGGIVLSIPGVMLFAFGQLVSDTRSIRDHLAALPRDDAFRGDQD